MIPVSSRFDFSKCIGKYHDVGLIPVYILVVTDDLLEICVNLEYFQYRMHVCKHAYACGCIHLRLCMCTYMHDIWVQHLKVIRTHFNKPQFVWWLHPKGWRWYDLTDGGTQHVQLSAALHESPSIQVCVSNVIKPGHT